MYRNYKLEEVEKTPHPPFSREGDMLIVYWIIRVYTEINGHREYLGEKIICEEPNNEEIMGTIRAFDAKYAEVIRQYEIIEAYKE